MRLAFALAALVLLLAAPACGHATTVRAGGERPVSMDLAAAERPVAYDLQSSTFEDRTSATQRAGRDYRRPANHSQTFRAAGPCGGWASLVAAHFPAASVGTACRVVLCESGGNPNAVNRSYGVRLRDGTVVHPTGLLQVVGGPTDPEANVALAASMFAQRGWGPWAASRGCWA